MPAFGLVPTPIVMAGRDPASFLVPAVRDVPAVAKRMAGSGPAMTMRKRRLPTHATW
jgi:hypothetical protein